jgi:hypothetical protein
MTAMEGKKITLSANKLKLSVLLMTNKEDNY